MFFPVFVMMPVLIVMMLIFIVMMAFVFFRPVMGLPFPVGVVTATRYSDTQQQCDQSSE